MISLYRVPSFKSIITGKNKTLGRQMYNWDKKLTLGMYHNDVQKFDEALDEIQRLYRAMLGLREKKYGRREF